MSEKFTKGPWYAVEDRGYTLKHFVIKARKNVTHYKIARVSFGNAIFVRGKSPKEEIIMKANAALISAAPELLKYLEPLCDLTEASIPGHKAYLHKKTLGLVSRARKAIKKARGE